MEDAIEKGCAKDDDELADKTEDEECAMVILVVVEVENVEGVADEVGSVVVVELVTVLLTVVDVVVGAITLTEDEEEEGAVVEGSTVEELEADEVLVVRVLKYRGAEDGCGVLDVSTTMPLLITLFDDIVLVLLACWLVVMLKVDRVT